MRGALLSLFLAAACGRSELDFEAREVGRDAAPAPDAGEDGGGGKDAGPGCPECPEGTVCDPLTGACVPECTCKSDADCTDSLACNGVERCNGCTCEPGAAVDCPEDAIACTDVLCNDDTGGCIVFPDHTLCARDEICDAERGCVRRPCGGDPECDDAVFCNGPEECLDGECRSRPQPVCGDDVTCTVDSCDHGRDRCIYEPDDARCSDGLFCTGEEVCDAALGCGNGPDPSCADALDCTTDYCSPDTDACRHDAPDGDRDGHTDDACGGDDCDDGRPEVHPGAAEVCDGSDQDCDGTIDDGVLSECGDCRSGCQVVTLPDEQDWDTDPGASNGVTIEPDGDLVLQADNDEVWFAWIANTNDSTVSKLDTRTGDEVARYASVTDHPANGARSIFEACNPEGAGGNCPSRTAVDLRGDVWVANRAFGHQGTVTKIANFQGDCVDVDGDGTIETSADTSGNGRIDPADATEFLGLEDECILFTVDVGESNERGDRGIPRAVAIDADGHPWIGLFAETEVDELDPSTGATLSTVNVEVNPYGAAIDSTGILWLAGGCCGSGEIQSVDTNDGSAGDVVNVVSTNGCVGNYGIAIDTEDRVWLAGMPCEAAFRYDPEDDDWFTVSLPGSGLGRGIAAATDGKIWVGASHDVDLGTVGIVTSFRAIDGGGVRTYELPTGLGTIGVGLDADGNVWAISHDTDNAARIDVSDGSIEEFPVGREPYTYSDFTGYALRNITAPSGTHREVIAGCPGAEWEELTWDATMPAGTSLEVRVRSADTIAGLAAAAWVGPWDASPADLTSAPGPVPDGFYLEIEVTLFSDGGSGSPVLHSVSVQVNCP